MRTYRATTKVSGIKEPFVDWYEAENLADAKSQYEIEAEECGLPADRAVEFVECNPVTLKPL